MPRPSVVLTSTDGQNWTEVEYPYASPMIPEAVDLDLYDFFRYDHDVHAVTWRADVAKFVAVGLTNTGQPTESSDGITWTPHPAPTTGTDIGAWIRSAAPGATPNRRAIFGSGQSHQGGGDRQLLNGISAAEGVGIVAAASTWTNHGFTAGMYDGVWADDRWIVCGHGLEQQGFFFTPSWEAVQQNDPDWAGGQYGNMTVPGRTFDSHVTYSGGYTVLVDAACNRIGDDSENIFVPEGTRLYVALKSEEIDLSGPHAGTIKVRIGVRGYNVSGPLVGVCARFFRSDHSPIDYYAFSDDLSLDHPSNLGNAPPREGLFDINAIKAELGGEVHYMRLGIYVQNSNWWMFEPPNTSFELQYADVDAWYRYSLMSSTSGDSWTGIPNDWGPTAPDTTNIEIDQNRPIYALGYGNERLVCCGHAPEGSGFDTGEFLCHSDDGGYSWTPDEVFKASKIIYAPEIDLWIAIPEGDRNRNDLTHMDGGDEIWPAQQYLTSSDGANWTAREIDIYGFAGPDPWDVAGTYQPYEAYGGSSGGTGHGRYEFAHGSMQSIAWNGTEFIAVGRFAAYVGTWTGDYGEWVTEDDYVEHPAVFSYDYATYCVIGSPDGINWTKRSTPLNKTGHVAGAVANSDHDWLTDVSWSPTLGMWVAVGVAYSRGGSRGKAAFLSSKVFVREQSGLQMDKQLYMEGVGSHVPPFPLPSGEASATLTVKGDIAEHRAGR